MYCMLHSVFPDWGWSRQHILQKVALIKTYDFFQQAAILTMGDGFKVFAVCFHQTRTFMLCTCRQVVHYNTVIVVFPLRCAPGYYGDPMVVNGIGCQACNCNPQGSVDATCDLITGQCTCFRGIRGRACDQCQPLYAVVDGVCRCMT